MQYIGEVLVMPFFEGKIELYQILLLIIIPLGTPILMFFIKRKLLWVSPIMALIIGLILTTVFYPYIFYWYIHKQ